jgi:hypothetical protein
LAGSGGSSADRERWTLGLSDERGQEKHNKHRKGLRRRTKHGTSSKRVRIARVV